MDNFVVSARKYRPQTFKSVVGQESITSTLQSAIKNNHLAQAFLFCGPRGVGKTTCARILAREINADAAQRKGEDTNADFSLNIFELDAASNNSVDDIRNLTDQVRFAPQVGTFKVYIIDEVHMLSQQAFNAFLKTLEEPPAHAIFILATTEKHKILPTILSRCQIFDFQRITVKDISDHLSFVAKSENVTAEPEALGVIAQKADGALRDALSMFDQLVSFAGNHLSYSSVIANLNVLDYDYYFKMTEIVMEHDIPASLVLYNDIIEKGFDGHNFIYGFMEHLRNLLVCKNPNSVNLLETSETVKPRYQEQSANTSVRFIFKALEVLNECETHYKASKNQRLLVELCLMRLCAIVSEKKNLNNRPEVIEQLGENETTKPIVKIEKPLNTKPIEKVDSEHNEETLSEKKTLAAEPQEDLTMEVEPNSEQVTSSSNYKNPTARIDASVAEERKKTLSRFKTVSVSISDTMGETASQNTTQESEDNEVDEELEIDVPAQPFDESSLISLWDEYANTVKTEGRMNLHSTLTKRKPQLKEDYKVLFFIDNAAQEIEMNREKADFVEFLRTKLNNFLLDLSIEITEVDEVPGLYTNSKKFEAMVKKNPNLGKLSQNLNLDIY